MSQSGIVKVAKIEAHIKIVFHLQSDVICLVDQNRITVVLVLS